jgi:predicted RNA binding protein YcfA (HicA-like mRNA interferase family)
MKRTKLLRHLRQNGCRLLREGGSHSLWMNPATGAIQPVPRHAEVAARLARVICLKLAVEPPAER